MSDPNEKNNAELWALDVNEVGIDGAKKRWQTKVDRDYWEGPLVALPFWDGIPEYRRDPSAPPLPSDEPDSEGWIAWDGIEQPVSDETLVEVKLDDSEILSDYAHLLCWDDAVWPLITAYRVIEPASGGHCAHSADEICDNCREAYEQRKVSCLGATMPSDNPHAELSGADLWRDAADICEAGGTPFDYEVLIDGKWGHIGDWNGLFIADKQGKAIRRKPRVCTITANGVDYTFPHPMTEATEHGSKYWLIFDDKRYKSMYFDVTRPECNLWLTQGRCHATREARDAHERALIAASGGRVSS